MDTTLNHRPKLAQSRATVAVRADPGAQKPSEASSALDVTLQRAGGEAQTTRFEKTFLIGRGAPADVSLDDPKVSQRHVQVLRRQSGWWVRDLGSTNGTYLNDERVAEARISRSSTLRLGLGGPLLRLNAASADSMPSSRRAERDAKPGRLTVVLQQYQASLTSAGGRSPTLTALRGAMERIRRQDRKRFRCVLGVIASLLVASTAFAVREHARNRTLMGHATDIFYRMKALEVQIAKSEREGGGQDNGARLTGAAEQRRSLRMLQNQYDLLLEDTGVLSGLDAQERLIFRIARMFGECELSMPEGFVTEVKRHIRAWQRSSRLRDAMERLEKNGLGRQIGEAMLEAHLPPQLLYVALAESDYRRRAVGPRTRYGIAKGMWQFIPSTAHQFGLRTGPLVELPRYDPRDDRFNVDRATQAAAAYLRYIYDTEAQASGLLVLAAYNWGHNAIKRRIRLLPDEPEERNFWRLLESYEVPRETYRYVLSIVAAAVIGEDPGLFGFDFANPVREARAARAEVKQPAGTPPS